MSLSPFLLSFPFVHFPVAFFYFSYSGYKMIPNLCHGYAGCPVDYRLLSPFIYI
ncbi:hypothetical protein BDV23DRAFT_148842 [Aspergillus alliaceus]|uniref:Uncharacterized protein n=1 Tax=Petromyces alliaceus TaxID=209559 RepID=A0A5N7CI84_PETAA|nr:hypothetical protein BDV23DRAFT_148842 [Aspergillus alliaceus]